ncbi:MAG: VWA domain-containing protein [Paludibacteraceae bacterium]|nr:VWA domain-containing protein [Paludibacteraceae bacterium]MBR3871210.1 VWA domain-containing protein [Paludibacteraceae bacterium]
MFRFARPEFLYLLILVPVLIGFFYYALIIKSKRLKTLGNKALLRTLMPEASRIRPRAKFYLLLVALVLSIFMMAGPQFGTKLEKQKRQGAEVVIAVDVSNSMLSQDLKPDRMSRAKRILGGLIDNLQEDKVALMVFAGDAYVQMPLTTDVSSAKMFLSNINPGMVPIQGTAIGMAIKRSMSLFSNTDTNVGKTIIIITDGENHEDDAVAMSKKALESGITVNVMGVGTPEGAPIPIAGTNSFRKDKYGNVVVTKLNESMCQEIASAGGGAYVKADNSSAAVRALTSELEKLSKSEIESQVYSQYNEQYTVIAWIVLILLVVECLLLERKNPLFKNIKLFS